VYLAYRFSTMTSFLSKPAHFPMPAWGRTLVIAFTTLLAAGQGAHAISRDRAIARLWFMAITALLGVGAGSVEAQPKTPVAFAPAPEGEQLSDDFRVSVEGQTAPVYRCRVSAVPLNQAWRGYQRPLDQTELASFACWDMAGATEVKVFSRRPVDTVAIKPSSLGIKPVVTGDTVAFRLPRPCCVTVEVNGSHHALHLFASPPETEVPKPTDPGVRYFGPGTHRPGEIVLKSNEILYVAAGAVVYGAVHAYGATGVRILGRGILDGSDFERDQGRGGIVRFWDCSDVVIDGVVMRDPNRWCCTLFGCRNARIANVKLIDLWRYNSDGIDICNSQDVAVRNCFVRAFDDCIVVKGVKGKGWKDESYDDRPVKDVDVSGCVLWNDWGRALEIGVETHAPEIARVTFRDCDIIRTVEVAMDIQHAHRAAVHDIRFENIRVEIDDFTPAPHYQSRPGQKYAADPKGQWRPKLMVVMFRESNAKEHGIVRNVVFKDISVTGRLAPASELRAFDAEHGIDRVVFENVRINGRPITDADTGQVKVGPHVRDVKFISSP
jgi:hypothetical protein